VLGPEQLAQPRATGPRAALSVRLAARRSAVQAAGDAQRQLHALGIAAPQVLRERLRIRSTRQLVATCARLRIQASWDVETATTAATLPSLARRIRELTSEAADHRQAILVLVRAWRPDLLARQGVGPIVAATVLCAWSHPGRCRSDAAFAMLGGAAPIPASSGQTVRMRLNRSGDRQLNQALYTVVLTRLRTDPTTRAYASRRRAQGKTNREIKRCLIRYVARQLYRLLETQPALDPTQERPVVRMRRTTSAKTAGQKLLPPYPLRGGVLLVRRHPRRRGRRPGAGPAGCCVQPLLSGLGRAAIRKKANVEHLGQRDLRL
jgi:transposase